MAAGRVGGSWSVGCSGCHFILYRAGPWACATCEQQREELASMLNPEEIELLGDTHQKAMGAVLGEGVSFTQWARGMPLEIRLLSVSIQFICG